MSEYLIEVSGCDDTTYARVRLTPDEAGVVERVFAAANARSFVTCQPKARLVSWESAGEYEREAATEKHWSEEDA